MKFLFSILLLLGFSLQTFSQDEFDVLLISGTPTAITPGTRLSAGVPDGGGARVPWVTVIATTGRPARPQAVST